MNDDNSQMKFEQDQQQEWEDYIQKVRNANTWHEKNHLILDEFNKVRPLIKPVQPDSCKQIAQLNCANQF